MAPVVYPLHAMSDAEQARVRYLSMAWLLLAEDAAAWQKEYAFLLVLKAVAGMPRREA